MKVTKKCAFCGQSFETRSGMQRYCSEACQAEAKRAKVMQKNNLFKLAQPLMEIQHQEYLTFSKAATLMGCSRQYIYKLVATGKLNASRISNRMAFIRSAEGFMAKSSSTCSAVSHCVIWLMSTATPKNSSICFLL